MRKLRKSEVNRIIKENSALSNDTDSKSEEETIAAKLCCKILETIRSFDHDNN